MRFSYRVLQAAMALSFALTVLSWAQAAEAGSPIDINTASESELQRINGIGPSRARAIVEHRERHGPFRSLDSLTDVRGIGPAILERVRPHVRAGTDAPPPMRERGTPRRDGGSEHSSGDASGRININTASESELVQITGVGPARAQAIIGHRERQGPFRSVDSLTDVHGIGPAVLDGMRDQVTVDSSDDTRPRARERSAPESPTERPAPRRAGEDGERSPPQGDFDLDLTDDDPRQTERRRERLADRRGNDEPRSSGRQRQARPDGAEEPTGRINLNTADAETLTRLPGIGPARADTLISHRRAHGPFKRVEQVTDVSGIGPATYDNIRDSVTIRLDLNGATLSELEAIGVDMDAAQQLIAWREKNGPFETVEQIVEVPGFGRGALETLKPLLWVSEQ